MRKIKLQVTCKIPSWNFCNHDVFTDNGRYSKDTCRFCVKTKTGHYCVLHDKALAADDQFVYKAKCCIDTPTVAEEATVAAVDPRTIISETIKQYRKLEQQLLAQGYPPNMAASLAERYMKGETNL